MAQYLRQVRRTDFTPSARFAGILRQADFFFVTFKREHLASPLFLIIHI